MITLRAGRFPGKLDEVAIAEGTRVGDVLDMIGIELGEEDIKLDDVKVDVDDTISEGAKYLIIAKPIKGAVR